MQRKYIMILFILAIISPLGLLAQGTAWGEWGPEDMTQLLGYVPQGINQAQEWWKAIFPDYTIPYFGEEKIFESIGYICSAIIGSSLIYGLATAYGRIIVRKNARVDQKLTTL
jgi:cobalt/nickel transport protein